MDILPQPIAEAVWYHFNNISDAANVRKTARLWYIEDIKIRRKKREQRA
jgi:hypothetical protein